MVGAQDHRIKKAIWEGDVDLLEQLAPCQCCCHEHTFVGCPARQWNGCRGGAPGELPPSDQHQIWAEFYARTRGWSLNEFYGLTD